MKWLWVVLVVGIGCTNRLDTLQDEANEVQRMIDYCAKVPQDSMERKINFYANLYELSPDLIYSVIEQESGMKPWVVSKAGAVGLMQIMPKTRDLYAPFFYQREFDLFDIDDSLKLGCFILKMEIDNFGLEAGLAAYNGGAVRGKQWALGLFHEVPEETRKYVPAILGRLD